MIWYTTPIARCNVSRQSWQMGWSNLKRHLPLLVRQRLRAQIEWRQPMPLEPTNQPNPRCKDLSMFSLRRMQQESYCHIMKRRKWNPTQGKQWYLIVGVNMYIDVCVYFYPLFESSLIGSILLVDPSNVSTSWCNRFETRLDTKRGSTLSCDCESTWVKGHELTFELGKSLSTDCCRCAVQTPSMAHPFYVDHPFRLILSILQDWSSISREMHDRGGKQCRYDA